MLQQLQHQYRLMQQHQQQIRNQRQTPVTTPVIIRPGQTPPFNGTNQQFSTQVTQSNGTQPTTKSFSPTQFKSEKLLQPTITAPIANSTKELMPNSNDLDVSEEDIQDLLSQKDLATTLAENLLKQLGSEDIDIKEEPCNGKYKKKLSLFFLFCITILAKLFFLYNSIYFEVDNYERKSLKIT